MSKYLKLLAIPLALTVTEGCASFNNAIRNVRHSIERATRKKAPRQKPIATGFGCAGSANVSRSIRMAKADLRAQLDERWKELQKRGVRADELKIVTIPEEPSRDIWSESYSSNDYSMSCAFAEAHMPDPKADPKPTPEPADVNETVPSDAAATVQE